MTPPVPPLGRGVRTRRITLVLALLLSLTALIQAQRRAQRGHNALIKWGPVFEDLEAGRPIYETGAEGYPTLPLSLLVLAPFHAVGDRAGPLLWALFKLGLAWWIVVTAFALAGGQARAYPPWGQLAVLLLSFRVLSSDLSHGNLNLLVGATVVAAAVEWRRGNEFAAGLWIGLGTVLKVTPVLAALLFLRKGSWRALVGLALGVLAFALLVPGLWLGWERNLALAASWWRQMITPYLAGRELTLLQTEHINQSLLGVLGRLTTDAVAIPARPPAYPQALRIHLLTLSPAAFRMVHGASLAAVLAWLLTYLGPRGDRHGPRVLGEFSMLALAMVMLSERSWKQHYVLLPLPLAYLVWHLLRPASPRVRRIAAAGLLVAGAGIGLSGQALLGARGSDLAEAWGAFLVGGLALLVACGRILGATSPPALSRETG